jgi:hypothetical protein
MTSNENRPRRRISCVPLAEALETRQVLTGGAGNTIAIMTGQIVDPAKPATLEFTIDPESFTLARGRVSLGIDVVPASNSPASPVIASITEGQGKHVSHKTYASGRPVTSGGQPITPAHVVDLRVASPRARKTAPAGPRSYDLAIAGKNNTTGAFLAGFYLIGDADGNGKVDRKDLGVIRKALGAKAGDTKYNFDADANRDGRISATDMMLSQKNLGAKTTIMPLITADLAVESDTGTPDRVTAVQNVTLTGVASTGATITYREIDAKTPNSSATADATGKYSITIPLAEGTNTFHVTSADSFGQTIAGTIAPITYKPPTS